MTIPNKSSINLGTTETIAFWVKGTPTAAFGELINKDDGTIGWIMQNTNTNANKDLYLRIDTSGGISQVCTGFPGLVNVLDGTWHHVVFVINNGACTPYRDGVAGVGGTYTVGGGFANSTVSFRIGQGSNSISAAYDDVRIYNRALSAQEVQQLYLMGN